MDNITSYVNNILIYPLITIWYIYIRLWNGIYNLIEYFNMNIENMLTLIVGFHLIKWKTLKRQNSLFIM